MNHYTLSEKLRKARRRYTISAGAQALYYELMAISNEEGWSEVFKCTASELCAAMNKSEKSVTAYRIELMKAELVGYISGKSKRDASTYSLFGSRFGSMIGSNIYHQSEYQSEYLMVEKTPDLNKTKRETKTSHSYYQSMPEAEKQRLLDHWSNSKKGKEEKSSGQKEEIPPTPEEADQTFKKLYPSFYDLIRKDNPAAATEELRLSMLKIFWEENIDGYKTKFPPWKDVITHFRNWVPKYTFVKTDKNKNTNAVTNSNTKHSTAGRQRTEDLRNDRANLKDKSTEFLRRANH